MKNVLINKKMGDRKENTESPSEEPTERSVAQEEIPKNRITICYRIKL
jgi:hypothetical protein